MSNFLNNGFTDLNCLTNIDSDEIRTNTLYVNGVQIVANSSNFDIINCSELICQNDISSNTIYATTSIQNVPVAKFVYLINVSSDIQAQFNNITNNYATKTQVSNNFNSFGAIMANTYVTKTTYNSFVTTTNNNFNNYALISSLASYVLLSQLSDYALLSQLSDYALLSQLSDYALLSQLSDYALLSSLSDYVTNSSLSSQLANYTNSIDLSNNYVKNILLSNYVTNSSLSSQLSNYTTTSDLSNNYVKNSVLSNYVTNSSLSSTLSGYCIQSNYTALKTQADATTLLLTGASWDATYQYLNLAYNSHIYGTLFVGPSNDLNVNSILTSLPSIYATITTLNQSLLNYVTNTSLTNTLNSYATNSSVDSKVSNLQSQINSVKSQSDGNSAVIATNTTAIAGLAVASASQQTQITGLLATIGAVQGGLTTAEGQITTLQAKTSLQNVVGAYTQFTGGIKIMNGLVYTSIINNDGSSDFYALMTLRQGLAVTNGIQSDRVTTATELKSNGTLEVVGTSTLSTTNLTTGSLTITNGKLTISGTNPNTFNNDCIFNGGITATNLSLVNGLSLTELSCNNLKFSNSVGNNAMNIGTNGGSLLSPNSIYIGNTFSTTYLNGLVVFSGLTFNMSSFINQVGF